jgi:hypothetical protein
MLVLLSNCAQPGVREPRPGTALRKGVGEETRTTLPYDGITRIRL